MIRVLFGPSSTASRCSSTTYSACHRSGANAGPSTSASWPTQVNVTRPTACLLLGVSKRLRPSRRRRRFPLVRCLDDTVDHAEQPCGSLHVSSPSSRTRGPGSSRPPRTRTLFRPPPEGESLVVRNVVSSGRVRRRQRPRAALATTPPPSSPAAKNFHHASVPDVRLARRATYDLDFSTPEAQRIGAPGRRVQRRARRRRRLGVRRGPAPRVVGHRRPARPRRRVDDRRPLRRDRRSRWAASGSSRPPTSTPRSSWAGKAAAACEGPGRGPPVPEE